MKTMGNRVDGIGRIRTDGGKSGWLYEYTHEHILYDQIVLWMAALHTPLRSWQQHIN